MAPKSQTTKRRAVDNTDSAKPVDSDVSNEPNEEIAEEGSERSSQSRSRNKGRRDPLVEKLPEIVIAREASDTRLAEMMLAHESEMMMAPKATDAKLAEMMLKPSQSNKPVDMLDGKKTNNNK